MIKKRRIIDPIKIVWLIRLHADDTSNEAGAFQLEKDFLPNREVHCHARLSRIQTGSFPDKLVDLAVKLV